MREFWREFCRDQRGNYALVTVLAMVPLMGGVAMAVDYTEMASQKQEVVNALDAANFATARRLVEGATDDQLRAYALDFFKTNLNNVDPVNTTLDVTLPASTTGGGLIKLCANLVYDPYFLPAAAMLIGKTSTTINYSVCSQVRLKNTLEVRHWFGAKADRPSQTGGQAARRHAGLAGVDDQADRQARAVLPGAFRGIGQCRPHQRQCVMDGHLWAVARSQ
jgi:Flp pilus assembly protein TadG